MIQEDVAYLMHMRDAAQAVVEYVHTHTPEQFEVNTWDQAAAVRNLEVIGEAANHVSKETCDSLPGIPWRDIIDFRNVAIHDYMDLDFQVVWNIMKDDVPQLLQHLAEFNETILPCPVQKPAW